MNKIVCMVRGGEAGRVVQQQAVTLAKREQKPLIFLHVLSKPPAVAENDALSRVAYREMSWLGHVMLSMARKRALEEGVDAETALRFEPVYEAIEHFVQENEADTLLLGQPRPESLDYETRNRQVQQFAQQLTEATGVYVEIVGMSNQVVNA